MQLPTDIKGDIKAAKRIRLPWWALLCLGIGSFLAAWLFDHLGRLDLVLPALNSVFVLGFAVAVKWRLRRLAWFWITMIIIAALHVPSILLVPWTAKWVPAVTIAIIDSTDFCAILFVLAVVGRFMDGLKGSEA
jgi:hypothetical protein